MFIIDTEGSMKRLIKANIICNTDVVTMYRMNPRRHGFNHYTNPDSFQFFDGVIFIDVTVMQDLQESNHWLLQGFRYYRIV